MIFLSMFLAGQLIVLGVHAETAKLPSITVAKVADTSLNGVVPTDYRGCEEKTSPVQDAPGAPATRSVTGCGMRTAFGYTVANVWNGPKGYFSTRVSSSTMFVLPALGESSEMLLYTYASSMGTWIMGHVPYESSKMVLNKYYDGASGSFYRYDYTLDSTVGMNALRNNKNNYIGFAIQTLAISENGKWLAIQGVSGEVYLYDTTTWKGRTIAYLDNTSFLVSATNGMTMAVSNDGRYIVKNGKYLSKPASLANKQSMTIYDTTTCADYPIGTAKTSVVNCRSVDMWNGVEGVSSVGSAMVSQLSDVTMPLKLRFSADATEISFYGSTNNATAEYRVNNIFNTKVPPPPFEMNLMAVGDSYISGEGAEYAEGGGTVSHYIAGTNTSNNKCHNSDLSYPYLLAAKYAKTFHSVACSGAVTGNVYTTNDAFFNQLTYPTPQRSSYYSNLAEILAMKQLGTISQIDFVTKNQPNTIVLSLGGNDIGFAKIITRCVLTLPGDPCFQKQSDRKGLLETIYSRHDSLVTTYKKVLENSAPNAKLYVVGYPEVINPSGVCAANVFFDPDEREFAYQLIKELNKTVKNAAESAGAYYVNNEDALQGHALCDETANGVNGLTFGDDMALVLGKESFHPTTFGHQLLMANISVSTKGLTADMPQVTKNSRLTYTPENAFVSSGVTNEEIVRRFVFETITPTVVLSPKDAISMQTAQGIAAAGALYEIIFHSEPVKVAEGTTAVDGSITASVIVPNLSPGVHSINIHTTDPEDKPISITQTIFIKANETDYDGDGIVNSEDEWPFINDVGHIVTPPEDTNDESDTPSESDTTTPAENNTPTTSIPVPSHPDVNTVVPAAQLLPATNAPETELISSITTPALPAEEGASEAARQSAVQPKVLSETTKLEPKSSIISNKNSSFTAKKVIVAALIFTIIGGISLLIVKRRSMRN